MQKTNAIRATAAERPATGSPPSAPRRSPTPTTKQLPEETECSARQIPKAPRSWRRSKLQAPYRKEKIADGYSGFPGTTRRRRTTPLRETGCAQCESSAPASRRKIREQSRQSNRELQ